MEISGSYIDELAFRLNPKSHKNWETLAGRLNYNKTEIQNFGLQPTEATQRLLQSWGCSATSTVHELHKALMDIQREDAAEILRPLLDSKKV